MPIELNLKEKCYLVALFGDISERNRSALFSVSQCPAIAPVIEEGRLFMQRPTVVERIAGKRRRRSPAGVWWSRR